MERIRALFVDDQETLRAQYAENIKIALLKYGVDLDVKTAERVEDAKRMLAARHDFRLVVTDVLYRAIDADGSGEALRPRGLEVVNEAARSPGMAIVAISIGSTAFPRLEELARTAGAHVFRFRQDVQSTFKAWDNLASEIHSVLVRVGAIRADYRRSKAVDQGTTRQEGTHMLELRTLSILYMDLSGWSRRSPDEIELYLANGLPKLAATVDKHERVHQNTWGDALIATFTSVARAAECALDIRDLFRRTPPAQGVASGMVPRVALHVGEVIVVTNPLRSAEDVFGDAVHRAARLEPATEAGAVYCTEAFAMALNEVKGCAACAYFLAEMQLPKGYGKERVHVVLGPGEATPTTRGGTGTRKR